MNNQLLKLLTVALFALFITACSPSPSPDPDVDVPGTTDTTPPVITVIGDNPATVYISQVYVDAGATATDDVDGSVPVYATGTDPVLFTFVGTYVVTYTASDTAGNTATATRTVNALPIPDTTPPVITILGANPQSVDQGSTYVDPGATATDDADGDISSSITVSGSVDTATPGTYILSYDVQDTAGNTATATRVVYVFGFLEVGEILYPGFDPARLASNGSDQAVYKQDLTTATQTRLWGGYQCPPGGCGEMYPTNLVPSRTGNLIVFQGGNIPCLAVMSTATLNPVCGTVPWGAGWSETSFDITQSGDVAVISERLDPSNFPLLKNFVMYLIDQANGIGGSFIVTNGSDIDTSPVVASPGDKNSVLSLLFIRNGTEIWQQSVDAANNLLVGSATLFASNVLDGDRAMSVNSAYTHVAFMRDVGGISHIFVKPLIGGVEVDLGEGQNPYWATGEVDMIKFTDGNLLWAMNSDGTGRVKISIPSNIASKFFAPGILSTVVTVPAGF